MNQELPNLPIEKSEENDGLDAKASGSMIVEGGLISCSAIEGGGGLWEDVDTQTFYETFPQLRAMLPGILFKDSEQPTLPPLEDKINQEEEEAPVEETADSATAADDVVEELEKSSAADADAADEAESDVVSGSLLKQMMDSYVTQLPNNINRDLIDRAAIDFVTNLNTKQNRKKLVKALFTVHRNRLDLLPFYARLVAVLQPVGFVFLFFS